MNPNPKAPNPYLKTRVMTASPEELRLMLYEGAVKFARQARRAMEQDDPEAIYANLSRSQKIVLELTTSLDHKALPELCERLGALYTYVYRRMVDANMQRDIAALDEAIELLEFETETWRMLMQKLEADGMPRRPAAQTSAASNARNAPSAAAPMSTLSING